MVQVVRRDPAYGYLDSWLWIPKTYVNVEGVKSSLTYIQTDSHTGASEATILYKETEHHLLVPRAFWNIGSLPFTVIDCRPQSYEYVPFESRVVLDHRRGKTPEGEYKLLPTGRNVQTRSVQALTDGASGTLQLGCGHGKTPTFLHFIAQQQVPAIVMVDNSQLLEQWQREVRDFLTVPGGIGIIAAGVKDWQKGLVLATYHSVANWAETMPEEVRRWFGIVGWDEGHHLPAPVFARTATLFYGRRYTLTATPERTDGMHIIVDMHIGKVLHKDLSQPLTAQFIFYWTGLELDLTNPRCDVKDKNGEIHLSKVSSYFGGWSTRLGMILHNVYEAVLAGRHVLVLANSVDEVVNLMAVWTYGSYDKLITEIPYPTNTDVGETALPLELPEKAAKKLAADIVQVSRRIEQLGAEPKFAAQKAKLEQRLIDLQTKQRSYEVWKKCDNLHQKHRKAFIDQLMRDAPPTAGFLTYGVPAKTRQEFVGSKQVIFAITKYGKEGLDAPRLDTILVSSLFTSEAGLEQLKGRITGRPHPDKKSCLVIFYRDDVGPIHGMCDRLEKHMRNWPVENGGPLTYTHINNPHRTRGQRWTTLKDAFAS